MRAPPAATSSSSGPGRSATILAGGVTYAFVVHNFPASYGGYALSSDGGEIHLPQAGGYVLTTAQPSHTLAVYFLAS